MILLYETVLGYFLFKCNQIKKKTKESGFKNMDLSYVFFSKFFNLIGFYPFISITHAFQNIICITQSLCNLYLLKFLIRNLKILSSETNLGVLDFKLAANIYKIISIEIISNEEVISHVKSIKIHFKKIFKNKIIKKIFKAQRILSYFYCGLKIRDNHSKNESTITYALFLTQELDAGVKKLLMICKEWYSWYFPELSKILKNNWSYFTIVKFIKNKNKIKFIALIELGIILNSTHFAKKIHKASRLSIGSSISQLDLVIVKTVCLYIMSTNKYRKNISKYLEKKTIKIAPNLTRLIGESLSVQLLSFTGSLKSLSKLSSSMIQILGTEKKNFKKTKNNTIYGFLFNSCVVSKIKNKYHKKKILRHLANKSVMVARIDYFSTHKTKLYGQFYKNQISHIIKTKA